MGCATQEDAPSVGRLLKAANLTRGCVPRSLWQRNDWREGLPAGAVVARPYFSTAIVGVDFGYRRDGGCHWLVGCVGRVVEAHVQ